jgi:hypothetical protein
MKTLALDLDSGRLSRWVGDSSRFVEWVDRYGDLYTLRVHVYGSGSRKIPACSLQFLVKRPQRRDVKALWDLAAFSRVPSIVAPNVATYIGQVSVLGDSYREALKLDSSPGNDLPSVEFLGIIRAVTVSETVEAEFLYKIVNNGFRPNDLNLGAVYVGLSDEGSILIRSLDGPEWKELVVFGSGEQTTFGVGRSVLGPVSPLSVNDSFVRVQNGVLQIKNDDTNEWVNVLLRGPAGSTLSLGEVPPVGFSLSETRFKVGPAGRLLLRNMTTGNWHETRVELLNDTNVLALGTEYDDSQV